MPQSLIHLPKDAEFEIGGWDIIIRNHKIVNSDSLFLLITNMIGMDDSNRDTLYQFEKHGISYEAAIEYCVHELDNQVDLLRILIFWNYDYPKIEEIDAYAILNRDSAKLVDFDTGNPVDHLIRGGQTTVSERHRQILSLFSKSVEGRNIANMFIEKIRSCNNWGELYDELHPQNKFNKDVGRRISAGLKQCLKV